MNDAGDILRRVPAQNIEAEESVLGAILLDNDAVNAVLEVAAVEDFYRESHRLIFQAMVDLADRNEPVDAITLCDALRDRGVLEQIGGPHYIAELAARVPTAANAAYYARIVREKAVLRGLESVAMEIASGAISGDADEQLNQAEHKIFQLSERRVRPSFRPMGDIMQGSLKLIERLYDDREMITGVPSGFGDLDRITAGFQASDLIIIAARPSVGKTALALNIAAHAAMDAERPIGVAFFSLEMSEPQLALRLLCSEARVDLAKARAGFLRAEDFPKLAAAAARLSAAKLFIDDASDTSPLVLKAKCRRLARDPQNKLGLVVVDYLQLMAGSERKRESRQQEISEISRSLKSLAKELKIPVIALSQLNRQVETRQDRRPLLADLRESGAIEQDADVVVFIFRDEMYRKDSKAVGTAEVSVAKQRNGPTDTAILTYLSQYTRFQNYVAEPELGAVPEPDARRNGGAPGDY